MGRSWPLGSVSLNIKAAINHGIKPILSGARLTDQTVEILLKAGVRSINSLHYIAIHTAQYYKYNIVRTISVYNIFVFSLNDIVINYKMYVQSLLFEASSQYVHNDHILIIYWNG